MGCGCGGRGFTPRRSSATAQQMNRPPTRMSTPTRTASPHQPQQQAPQHIVQSQNLAQRRAAAARRQV